MSWTSWSWNAKDSSTVDMMPYLPDDLLLNCLARVSRSYYQTLSLVSKRFRCLLASTELDETRRLLGITENCLYFCLEHPYRFKTLWFSLSREATRIPRWSTFSCFSPCRILTKRTKNLMISVPSQDFSHPSDWKAVTIGFNVYMIGGSSTRVSVMDCRSHTWHEAPSMQVAREHPLVSVVDGKIYVVERRPCYNYSNFMEFFDPKTQKWEHAPSPGAEIRGKRIHTCLAKEGNLYLTGNKNMVYKPKENKWDAIGSGMRFSELNSDSSYCTIDNVEYCCYSKGTTSDISPRMIKWYDSERRAWRVLKGLKGLPKLRDCYYDCLRLVNYGGNIAVSWEENAFAVGSTKIWCAEIEIKRCKYGQEICGKVKWCDVVLTAPLSCSINQLVVATV